MATLMQSAAKAAPFHPVPLGGKAETKSVIAAAKQLMKEKLFPVPINSKVWGPTFKDWPKFSIYAKEVETYFKEGDFLGVILSSSGLIDVDFDAPETQAFADLFPPTRAISRQSKAISHLLYRISGQEKAQSFKTPDGAMLIEFRVGNQAVVVPPSVHPCGESLTWNGPPNFALASANDIKRFTREVAALSLIARYWPHEGSRHYAALATAGLLKRTGWSLEKSSDAMQRVAQAAHDEEVQDRISCVASTFQLAEEGKPIHRYS